MAAAIVLQPHPAVVSPTPEQSFTVDIHVVGLTSLLAAFELNLTFGPMLVNAQGFPSILFQPSATVMGGALGDVAAGEVIVTQDFDNAFGSIQLAAVSLLEADLATCVFCQPKFLSDLQPTGDFLLGTLRFNTFFPAIELGQLSVSVESSLLSDPFGVAIATDAPTDAHIAVVSEPSSLSLLAVLLVAGLVKRSGRRAWRRAGAAWACAIVSAGAASAAVPDPSSPGPYAVTVFEYAFAPSATIDVTDDGIADIPYPTGVAAAVWHPALSAAKRYPLVLLVHGRKMPATTPSYRGFDSLAARLASWGFIVVSINARDTLRPENSFANVLERGRLVQAHLRCWQAWSAGRGGPGYCLDGTLGARFANRVDMSQIGLMGHSQGGQAVRAAHQFNRTSAQPVALRAIYEIAPKDETPAGLPPLEASGLAWSVLLPGCDGDVADLEGMRVYDRAQRLPEPQGAAPKAQQFLFGARHNLFNSKWEAEFLDPNACAGQIRLDRGQHERAAAVYVVGFFRTFLRGDPYLDLFTGDRLPPPAVQTPVDNSFAQSVGAILKVDDFSAADAPSTNSLGLPNNWTGIVISACDNAPTTAPAKRCAGFDPTTLINNVWGHAPVQHAARISWPAVGPEAPALFMPTGARDLVRLRFLSLRVAEQNSPLNPPAPGLQDFSVRLVSTAGASSSAVRLGAWGTLHAPVFIPAEFGGVATPAQSILKTVRIPLSAFADIDLAQVAGVLLEFDQQPSGAIFVSDIAFSDRMGDLTFDGSVDIDDVNVVMAALGTVVPPGANDARDLDGDGRITALDARRLVLLCSRYRCAR
jgi:hypothetical protein